MASALAPLSASALVGLARKAPSWPAAPGLSGQLLAGLDAENAELHFLQTAGALSLMEEAGLEPSAAPAGGIAEAPEEVLAEADSARLQAAYLQLLAAGPPEIVCELIALLGGRKLRLPPEHLPALLNLAAGRPAVRKALGLLPGQRHRWLAELNPAWQRVLTDVADAVPAESVSERQWTEGTPAERTAVLRQVRAADPGRAREMLAAVFAGEPAKERQEFLAVLGDGISNDDIPFLERAQTDKSKGVRLLAAALLSRLPDSPFGRRMGARLEAWLTVVKKMLRQPKLEIAIPDEFDSAWAKDGIEEKPPQGEGAKAFWLRQTVSLTPLLWWEEQFQQTPEQMAELCITRSDWGDPLKAGLAAAAETQQNAFWAAAMVEYGPPNGNALAALAGPEAMEKFLTREAKLRSYVSALPLALSMESWSAEFAAMMLDGIRAALKREPDYTLYSLFPSVAFRLPPPLLPAAAAGWEDLIEKPYLRNALDAFLSSVQLRLTIHEELQQFPS